MFRSLIFVPSNNKRFIDKAKVLGADIVCFDLEDSVPINEKNAARLTIIEALKQKDQYKTNVYVRINSVSSELAFSDLESVVQKGLDGIVIPKVKDQNQISKIAEKILELEGERNIDKNSISLIPSIESAAGVVKAHEIAEASTRVNALLFGVFDFLFDMGLDYNENNDGIEYAYARSKIPVDARAAGVSSIDGIWQKVNDIDGLEKDSIVARRLGYSGKSIIHPGQIDTVHKIFVPNQSDVQWAQKVVEALRESMEKGNGRGAVKLEGKMIDAVHYKQARAVLDAAENTNKNKE